jgi:two-component system chemotaxis response regulator CheB
MAPIRVVVVDDSTLVRGLLTEIINREPDMQCVGAASDAFAARELIRELDPDVITLDVEMPRMDGLDFLARLMRLHPMPVVMVSTLTERGARATLRARTRRRRLRRQPRIGVAGGLRSLADELTAKLRVAACATLHRATRPIAAVRAPHSPAPLPDAAPADRVIFIGASTGGTEATRAVLMQLPADAPPILITQHMPPGFTRSYAERLDRQCRIRVGEARDGEPLRRGHALGAPGGRQVAVEDSTAGLRARVFDGEPVNRHQPSVEVLFESAAHVVGANAIGIMLTGMGADGATAMKAMRDAGAWNLAQDEASCVVFGMPREAIAAGAVHEVLPLEAIAARLIERFGCARAPRWSAALEAGSAPCRRQKDRLQIAQEIEPTRTRPDALQIALDQPAPLGFGKPGTDRRKGKPGAFAKAREREAVRQAQRVEYELERQVFARDFVVLRDRIARQRTRHVARRIPNAHLALNAVRKRELAVRAGAKAEIVADLPLVEVVHAAVCGAREGRDRSVRAVRVALKRDDRSSMSAAVVVVEQQRRVVGKKCSARSSVETDRCGGSKASAARRSASSPASA